MACFCPVTAWRAKEPNEAGKYPMVFNQAEGQDDPLDLPCGKCNGCRADQAMEWSVRLYHESLLHERNCFLTLTYDDEHLPDALVKKDLQGFFKRLRLKYKFRYFACGEYGEKTRRPHYHAIIFGQDFFFGSATVDEGLYTHLDVERAWGMGNISLAIPSMGGFCYVAGYCQKKIGDSDTFTVMSSRPAIGFEYFTRYIDDFARTGVVAIEGREYPVPKAYFRFNDKSNICWLSDIAHLKDERLAHVRERGFVDFRHLDNKQLLMKSKLKMRNEVI